MRVRPLGVDMIARLTALQRRRIEGRSKGRHLSDILKRINQRIDPERFGSDQPIDPKLAELGFLWEDVLSHAFALEMAEAGASQVELEEDGILMTLDGYRNGRVQESKATKISASNPITSAKFHHWMYQLKAYCRVARTLQAELYVLFINGDYDKIRFGTPIVRAHLIEYTLRELQENWEMVLRERDRMDKEGE